MWKGSVGGTKAIHKKVKILRVNTRQLENRGNWNIGKTAQGWGNYGKWRPQTSSLGTRLMGTADLEGSSQNASGPPMQKQTGRTLNKQEWKGHGQSLDRGDVNLNLQHKSRQDMTGTAMANPGTGWTVTCHTGWDKASTGTSNLGWLGSGISTKQGSSENEKLGSGEDEELGGG